jgi:hypothetical protein
MLALLRRDVAAACAWNVLTVPLALLLAIELVWRAVAFKARIPRAATVGCEGGRRGGMGRKD